MVDWKDKKVLICGGAGLIGSHMARRLTNLGSTVTCVDNLSSGCHKNLEDVKCGLIIGDLREYEIAAKYVNEADYVFQFAADMGGIGYITSIGADIMYNSVKINLNVLQAFRGSHQGKGLFYSSSACAYPGYKQTETDVPALKEEDVLPADPDEFYGWEKLFTEKLCEAYIRDYKLPIWVGRFHNIYGPIYTAFDKDKGKAPCHTIYKIIEAQVMAYSAQKQLNIDVWGDGKQTRSFMYVDDCVDAVLKLMETDHHEPINIGTDEVVTMDELTYLVAQIANREIRIVHDIDKPQGVRGRNADLTLFEEVLGFRPRYSLKEGMIISYEWALNHWEEIKKFRNV